MEKVSFLDLSRHYNDLSADSSTSERYDGAHEDAPETAFKQSNLVGVFIQFSKLSGRVILVSEGLDSADVTHSLFSQGISLCFGARPLLVGPGVMPVEAGHH